MPAHDDEPVITDLLKAFALATERGAPRDMAALMCADEAEAFLDNVYDPDSDDAAAVDEVEKDVLRVRTYGDVALASFIRPYFARPNTIVFRRENGRWTVCAEAEQELSLEQLEDDIWPAPPSSASDAQRRVHALRREPIGHFSVEDLRILLSQNPVSLFQLRRAIDKVCELGDLNALDAPHDLIGDRISTFLADHPG
jgi:hypothetical protein